MVSTSFIFSGSAHLCLGLAAVGILVWVLVRWWRAAGHWWLLKCFLENRTFHWETGHLKIDEHITWSSITAISERNKCGWTGRGRQTVSSRDRTSLIKVWMSSTDRHTLQWFLLFLPEWFKSTYLNRLLKNKKNLTEEIILQLRFCFINVSERQRTHETPSPSSGDDLLL